MVYQKNDVISRTTFIKRRDNISGFGEFLVPYAAYQHIWIEDVPGSDIGILEDMANLCDTAAELGNPDIDQAELEIKDIRVTARGCDANGGKAHVFVTWGRRNLNLGGTGGKGIKSAWVEPFWAKVRRYQRAGTTSYISVSGTDTAAMGENGYSYTDIEVPGAYLYDLVIFDNVPATWDTGVGHFTTLTGVPDAVLKHFPDITQYKAGTATAVWEIRKYEWRMLDYPWGGGQINGWVTEEVGADGTIIQLKHNEAPVAA